MTRYLVIVLLTAITAIGTEVASNSLTPDQAALVTFNKDVLPILQDNCQSCHRTGGIAPMPLVTYENSRPWAKAIKTNVVNKQMPPWFADSHYGEFRNAPKLTQANIDTLVAWADNGAREGSPADNPSQSPQWQDGWRIQPDVVVSMPSAYRVAAKGTGEVREFFIPNPFKEDTWVSSIEIRPGDPSVVHHVIVQVPDQAGLQVFKKEALQEAAIGPDQAKLAFSIGAAFVDNVRVNGNGSVSSYSDMLTKLRERQTGLGAFVTMEAVYAPGSQPLDFRYTDSAKLIPGGKQIRLEVHYTPNGKETMDKTMVGFTLAKAPAARRFVMMAPEHLVDTRNPIPAGAANWETIGELTFNQDADLAWFMPHMHLRGKDMTFRLIYPDGREETVLSAKFNFHWQLGYELKEPIKVPKGTRMIVTAHHDNSASNRENPTPGDAAVWGEMTSQEMMLPWFGVIVNGNAKPEAIASYKPGDLDSPLPGQGASVRALDLVLRK
jgi:hypothetical protein